MNPKLFWLITAILFVFVQDANAQQPKVHLIGFLGFTSLSAIAARIEAFRQGLREFGYIEGKNIVVEYRSAEGELDRLPELAAELVRLKVEVIVTSGPSVTRAVKETTTTIPIVMGFDTDPVGNGFVASLARPGGTITGLSVVSPEISGKQLELLKEIVPKLSHVAVLGASTNPGNAQALKETELAVGEYKVQLQYLNVLRPKDIEAAFRDATKGHAGAVLVLPSPLIESHRTQITDLAAKNRLPAMYYAPEFVEAGGLMSYGTSFPDLFRRAATYVDKILKGAKPSDLPVEQPTKFELVINLKAAKQIGLTIPPKRAGEGGSGDSMKVVVRHRSALSKSVVCFGVSALVLVLCVSAAAQQTKRIPRIGYLVSGSLTSTREVGQVESFRQGLRELGYFEGQNIAIEYRYADGVEERLPKLAAELVQLSVDVIFVTGTTATQAVKNATKTIPIVMTSVTDPIGTGIVTSLAHPDGNVTGLANLSELGGLRY